MGLNAKVGSFNIGTGAVSSTVAVTGVGFTPKAVLFWWTGNTETVNTVGAGTDARGIGWAVGTTSRCAIAGLRSGSTQSRGTRNDCCVLVLAGTTTVDGYADLSSFDADGFTLVIRDVFTASYRVHYLALGGSDITNVAQGQYQNSSTTSGATQDITTPGFQPDCVFFSMACDQSAPPEQVGGGETGSFGAALNASTAAVQAWIASVSTFNTYCRRGESRVFANTANWFRETVSAILSNGFRIQNVIAGGGNYYGFYLAIKGPKFSLGALNTATDGSNIVVSGLGFKPAAVLFVSGCASENAAQTVINPENWSLGAATGPTERVAAGARNNSTNSGRAVVHDECYVHITTSNTTDALMDIVSFDADGFTAVMDDPDSASNFVWYVAIGSPAVALTAASLAIGSPALGAPALLPAFALAASPLAVVAPGLAAPGLGQKHVLAAAGITTASPPLPSPTLLAISNLAAASFATAAPAIGTAAIGQRHVFAANGLDIAAPTIGSSALGQKHVLTAIFTAASPVLGRPGVFALDHLTAGNLAAGSPAFGTLSIGQVHRITAAAAAAGSPVFGAIWAWARPPAFTTGAPALATPALGQRHVLAALPLAVGPPAFTAVVYAGIGQIAAVPIALQPPVVGTPTLGQKHLLAAAGLTDASPALGTPTAAPVVYHLTVPALAVAAPAIGKPQLGQAHRLAVPGVTIAAISVGTPTLFATSVFTAAAVAAGAPQLGRPTFGQRHALATGGLAVGSWTHTPVVYIGHAQLAAARITTAAPTLGRPLFEEAHRFQAVPVTVLAPVLGQPALHQAHGLLARPLRLGLMILPRPKIGQVHALIARSQIVTPPHLGAPELHYFDRRYRHLQGKPRRRIIGESESAQWTGMPPRQGAGP